MKQLQTQVLEILDRAISEPTTPPRSPTTMAERKQALANANATIASLRSALGISHSMPLFNLGRAVALVAELEGRVAAKNAAQVVAAAPVAPEPKQEPTGSDLLDGEVAASGTGNLRRFKLKAKRDKLFATAANLPAGSTARACAEANLAKAQAELNECS